MDVMENRIQTRPTRRHKPEKFAYPDDKRFPQKLLLTESDAAHALSVSPDHLRRLRYAGVGPKMIRVGSLVRYDIDDLKAFVEERRKETR